MGLAAASSSCGSAAGRAGAQAPGTASALSADFEPLPKDVTIWASVARPSRILPVLKVTGALGDTSDVPDSAIVAAALTKAPVGAIVDLERPMYFATTGPISDPEFAVSAALVAGQATTRALDDHFSREAHGDGVERLVPRNETRARQETQKRAQAFACATVPVDGGRRLVCASTEGALGTLTPVVSRAFGPGPQTSDVHLEMSPVVWQSATKGHSSDPSPAAQLGYREGQRFLGDVGALAVDASFDGDSVDAALTLRFLAATSPLTSALLAQSSSAGAPPPAFAFLPEDAGMAIYGRGATAADLAPFRTWFDSSLLRPSVEEDGYSAETVDAILAAWDKLAFTGGPWVAASGRSFARERDGLDAYVSAGKDGEVERKIARASMQGWMLLEVDEPSTRWISGLREILRFDNLGPEHRGNAKTKAHEEKKEPQKTLSKMTFEPVPAGIDLPAGTAHLEMRTRPNPAWVAARLAAHSKETPAIAHALHTFIVPDGDRTWFALSEDAPTAAKVVLSALARAHDAAGARPPAGARAWEGQPTAVAGTISLAELALALADDMSDADLRKARGAVRALGAMGDSASAPIPFWLATARSTTGAKPGGAAALHLRLPVRAMVDAAPHMDDLF